MISPREESELPSKQEPVGSASGKSPGTDYLDVWLRQVGSDLRSLVETVRRITFVELQRLHLKAVDGFFRGGLYLCLLSAGVALSISAVLLLIAGIRGVLDAMTGSDWLADLMAGSFFLVVLWFGGLATRSALRLHVLRSTERGLRARGSADGQAKSSRGVG